MQRSRKHAYRVSVFLLVVFLASAVLLAVKVIEQELLLDGLIADVVSTRGLTSHDEIAIALSKEIYSRTNRALRPDQVDLFTRIESASFFNLSSAASLKYGFYEVFGDSQFGACGTMSRTLLNALWKLDIPARKLQILDNEQGIGGGHTVVEFFHDGAWRVVSPSDDGFVWRTEGGEIATAREIQTNPQIFAQIYAAQPNYPYLFDRYRHIRWSKFPDWFTSVIRSIIGPVRFNSMETPRLYDQPRTMLLYGSLSATMLTGILVYWLRPKRRVNSLTGPGAVPGALETGEECLAEP